MSFADINSVIASIGTTSTVVLIQHDRAAPVKGRASIPVATLTSVVDVVHHPDAGGRQGRMQREGGDSTNRIAVYFRVEVLPVQENPNGNNPWWISIDGTLYEVKAVEPWLAGGFWVAKAEEVSSDNARVYFCPFVVEEGSVTTEAFRQLATDTLMELGAWENLDPNAEPDRATRIASLVSTLDPTHESLDAWLEVVAVTLEDEEEGEITILTPAEVETLGEVLAAELDAIENADPFGGAVGFSPSRACRVVLDPEGSDRILVSVATSLSNPLVVVTFKAIVNGATAAISPTYSASVTHEGAAYNVYSFPVDECVSDDGLCRIEVL